MNAPTGRTGPHTTAVRSPATTGAVSTARSPYTEEPYTVHGDADRRDAPTDVSTDVRPIPGPAATTAEPAPSRPAVAWAARTVRLWVAAVIATAAFLLGLGVSMLLGPLGGPPDGGPGGAGGPGGDPGTSQSTQQGGTGTATGTGTAS